MLSQRLALTTVLALPLSLLFTGCSGSSSGGPVATRLAVEKALQERNVDPLGRTVDFRFSAQLLSSSVFDKANYIAEGGPNTPAALFAFLVAPDVVRVVFDDLVIPGETVFRVRNLRNRLGQAMAEQLNIKLFSTDTTPPKVVSVEAKAVPNSFNDEIIVMFDDLMIPWEIVDPLNYTFSTGGQSVDLTQAAFSYDQSSRSVTIRLINQNPAVNLQAGESYSLTVGNARDLGGNAISGLARVTNNVTGDTTPPVVLQATQNTAVDPLGATVDIAFDEVVSDTSVSNPGNYTGSGGQTAMAAKLLWPGDMVQVSFDGPVVPGTHQVAISGVEDLAGNQMAPIPDQPVETPDATPPTLVSTTATTVSGPFNDVVTVHFDEQVLPVGATTAANYVLSSPAGTTVYTLDPEAVLTYDYVTRTTTIVLASQTLPINLRTTDSFDVTVDNVSDVAGNPILPNTRLGGTVGGDATSPQVVQATQNTVVDPLGKTVDITFTEVLDANTASVVSNYVHSNGKTALAASTLGSGDVVRVSFEDPVVPQQDTVSVSDVEDLAGNVMPPAIDVEVARTDTTPPTISSIQVDAVSGQFNDVVRITYDEPVLPGGATVLSNFTLVASGFPVVMDPTDTQISYDQATMTTTIVLSSRTTPLNLEFGAPCIVTADNVSDVAGNVMLNESMSSTVGGDNISPRVLSAAASTIENTGNDYIVIDFDEELVEAGARNPSNFTLESPVNQTPKSFVDLSGASFSYTFDGPVSQVRAVLPLGVNLKTGDGFQLTVLPGVGDHAGNPIDPTANAFADSVRGDTALPILEQATQRTSVDPSGATIDLAFDEEIDGDTLPGTILAKLKPGASAPPAPNLVSASLIGTTTSVGAMVRLTFDGPVVPTEYVLDVYGIRDLAGNDMVLAIDQTVTAEDTTPPDIVHAGFEIEKGWRNDDLFITFDERVLPSDAMKISNYSLIAPGGGALPLGTDNVIFYDSVANRTHIVLMSQTQPVNLQFGDVYTVAVDGIRDLAGNVIPLGTTASDAAKGDNVGPTALQATQKTTVNPAGTTVFVAFDESLDPATAQDVNNYSGNGSTPISAVIVRSSTSLLTDIVSLTFAQPMPDGVPLDVLVAVDLAGNANNGQSLVVAREDQFDPYIVSVTATTVANRQNDAIDITFSELVLPGEATTPDNYRFWAPANSTQDSFLADQTFFWDEATLTATILLDSPLNRVDLKNEPLASLGFRLIANNIHDVSGRPLAQGPGVNDIRGPVDGDTTAPTLVSATTAPGLVRAVEVTFSEELDADTVIGGLWTFSQPGQFVRPVPGARTLLADGKTVRLAVELPASGDITLVSGLEDLAGNPAVPGSVTIN